MKIKYISPDMISNQECEYKGVKIGRLEGIAYLKEKASNQERFVLCKCECGNKTRVRASQFKDAQVLSCGCLRTEMAKENKYARWLPKLTDKIKVNDEDIYFFQFLQKTKMSKDEIVKKVQRAHSWTKIFNDELKSGNKKRKKVKK